MTVAITRLCCPDCRLRLTPADAAQLAGCPECGEPLQAFSLRDTVGFGLFGADELPASLRQAVAMAIPLPDLDGAGP